MISAQKVFFGFFALQVFLIPIWPLGSTFCTIIMLAISIIQGEWAQKWMLLKSNMFFWGTISLFTLYLISYLLFPSSENSFELQKRLGLLGIPLLLSSRNFSKKELTLISVSFICSVLFIDLRALLNITTTPNGFHLLNNGSIVSEIIQFERPYLGAFSCISISLILSTIKKNKLLPYYILVILVNFATIFIIGAKMAIIMSLSIVFIYCFIKLKKTTLLTPVLLSILLLPIITYFVIPSINSRVDQLIKSKHEPRIFIWSTAINVINSNSFNYTYGTMSEINTSDKLIERYKEETKIGLKSKWRNEVIEKLTIHNLTKEFDLSAPKEELTKDNKGKWWWFYADDKNFNTHNQFLGLFLNFGLLSLIPLLLIFIGLIKSSKHNTLAVYLVVIFILFMSVENVLSRQHFLFTFCIFGSLVTAQLSTNTTQREL